jgi:hypothetical protein
VFLSANELTELTGLKLPACQRRWLIRYGYVFEVDAKGHPKVLRKYLERRLGVIERESSTTIQPNYDVIRRKKHE